MPAEDPFEEARAQACEYLGFVRSKKITVGDEVFEIPNQSLMSYEQRKRYNALELFVQTSDELDRWPDPKDADGTVLGKGAPKSPWRNKAGELIEDDYDARLVQALFGKTGFAKFIKLGGNPSDVGLFWAEFNQRVTDRSKQDSKSDGGDSRLAVVPDSD